MDYELTSTLSRAGTTSPRVLAAMMRVDRAAFVPPGQEARAHEDVAVDIGHGQTVSQPSLVAAILTEIESAPARRILEVGTGSGWLAALLFELGYEVFSMERIKALAEAVTVRLATLDMRVHLRHADGSKGWPEEAPFDVIVVSAATGQVPRPLVAQLADGGRLILPLGEEGRQVLTVIEKRCTRLAERMLFPVVFVPLLSGAVD